MDDVCRLCLHVQVIKEKLLLFIIIYLKKYIELQAMGYWERNDLYIIFEDLRFVILTFVF